MCLLQTPRHPSFMALVSVRARNEKHMDCSRDGTLIRLPYRPRCDVSSGTKIPHGKPRHRHTPRISPGNLPRHARWAAVAATPGHSTVNILSGHGDPAQYTRHRCRSHTWQRLPSVLVHPILEPQESVTPCLEDAAQLERPGDFRSGGEEPEHLHCVSRQPGHEHRQPEALAGAGAAVREYLGKRESRFDGETDVTYQ